MTSADSIKPSRLIALVMAALVVRLFLMPISFHSDLLFVHYFPYWFSYQGIWDIYGHFGEIYLRQGFTYYPPGVLAGVAFFQWLLRPFSPEFGSWMETVHHLMLSPEVEPLSEYLGTLRSFKLWEQIFVMKLPWVFFDAGAAYGLWRIFEGKPYRSKALVLWLFFPVNLLGAYVIGQYRMIPVFFIGLLLLAAQRSRKEWVAFFLGCLCLLEVFPVFWILPTWLFLRGRKVCVGWLEIFLFVLPLGVGLLPFILHSGFYVLHSYFSPVILRMALENVAFDWWDRPLRFFYQAGAAGVYCYMLQRINRCGEVSFGQFVNACFISVLCVLAASNILFHYFMWSAPLFVIHAALVEKKEAVLLWAIVGCLFLFTLDQRALNWGLLSPLDPDRFMNTPSLHEWASQWLPWGRVVGGARLLFSALCLLYAGRLALGKVRFRPDAPFYGKETECV